METEIGGPVREFPPTRWTLIRSSQAGSPDRARALEELLTLYWKPLYFYVRRRGLSVEAAKDAVQGLYARFIEDGFAERLDPGRGHVRGYLRVAMDHHLANEAESRLALKRGGNLRMVPLDVDTAERQMAGVPEAAAAAFDREWAVGTMERALAKLRAEFESGARRGSFDVVLRFFRPGKPPAYADAAREAGMGPVQFKAFPPRARTRFRELILADVADLSDDPGSEMAEMIRLLSR